MRIRAEQMIALRKGMSSNFEGEMVAHLADFSPYLFKVIQEKRMRDAVRFGIKRAGEYGLTLRGPIRLYLELMLLFGSHFDTDPQYPWANEILAVRDSTPEMERAKRLHQRVLDYQEKVSGPDAVNTRKALSELSVLAKKPERFSSNDLVAELHQEMARLFPQKETYIGEEGIRALIRAGIDEARKYQFPAGRGEALVVVLMFAFGHGCTDDLLYPWIARTLNDKRIIDSTARVARLEKEAVTWLEHVLASPSKGAQT